MKLPCFDKLACPVTALLLLFCLGCFGTGVTPATRARLEVTGATTVSPGQRHTIMVRNVGAYNVVARNVRVRGAAGADGAALTTLQLQSDPACATLAAKASCSVVLTLPEVLPPQTFPMTLDVVADNADTVHVRLALALGDVPSDGARPQLSVSNVVLTPPAPARSPLVISNLGRDAVRITAIDIPAAAGLQLDYSSCPSFPHLAAQSSCNVDVQAPGSAVPGSYAVNVKYAAGAFAAEKKALATVKNAALVVNAGAPVQLDSNSTVNVVAVTNTGFDVTNLAFKLPWTDTCGGALSLSLDDSACLPRLAANATCNLLLSTLGATPGTDSTLTALTSDGVARSATLPVQIGSLSLRNLSFAAPGEQNLVLRNLGTVPLSVQAVRVGGNRAAGLGRLSVAELQPCQGFVGTCTLPVRVPVGAYAEGGATSITVSYSGNGPNQTASATLLVGATSASINNGAPITLEATNGNTQVTLTNTGTFNWVSPGLALTAPIDGLSITNDCPDALAPNASCTATLVTSATVASNVSAKLTPLGANLGPTAPLDVQVASTLLAIGVDSGGQQMLLPSYDAGASFHANAPLTNGMVVNSIALGRKLWVAVGSQAGNQAIFTSQDRGRHWQPVTLDAVPGFLTAVTRSGARFVAVGYDNQSIAVTLRYSDDGVHWSLPANNDMTAQLFAVTCSGNDCVSVGSGSSLSNGTALHSNDGAISWQPQAAAVVPPNYDGTLLSLASNGQAYVAVGSTSSGTPAILFSAPLAAGPYVAVSSLPSTSGNFSAVASNGTDWLAVGSGATDGLIAHSTDPSANVWSNAVATSVPVKYSGVAWTGRQWLAVGELSGQGAISRSDDGTTFTTTALVGTVALTNVASDF